MGGSNSGRHGGKRTTNKMDRLDVRLIHRAGSLVQGDSSVWTWTRGSGSVSRINMYAGANGVTLSYRSPNQAGEWQDYHCQVTVEWTACNYGGKRPWWICPDCGRRVAVLYGGRKYACRHCHDLTYKSTRTAPDSKHYARANKVRERLGWGGGVACPMGDRPKGMHLKTYLRLLTQLNAHSFGAMQSTDKLVSRLTGTLNSIRAGMQARGIKIQADRISKPLGKD